MPTRAPAMKMRREKRRAGSLSRHGAAADEGMGIGKEKRGAEFARKDASDHAQGNAGARGRRPSCATTGRAHMQRKHPALVGFRPHLAQSQTRRAASAAISRPRERKCRSRRRRQQRQPWDSQMRMIGPRALPSPSMYPGPAPPL
jgi:hypothetical protein